MITDRYILDTFDEALAASRIKVYYQPIIRTLTQQSCSFEALARWIDPAYGMIMPGLFIGALERCRQIHRLDGYVIRQVCAMQRRAIDEGRQIFPISVNLSRMDFMLCDAFAMVDDCAREYRVPRNFLCVEITEGLLADNEALMHSVIDRFRSAGYPVWMDDFGSGYSSLNLLKDYDFDELKVDMRFLTPFTLRARKVLTSVVSMAKDIGINILVEGVETMDQFRFLRDIGCDKVQGYLFGKPRPLREAGDVLRAAGISPESPVDAEYYNGLSRVNFLSASPFMTAGERDRLVSARRLNSIPLALGEIRGDSFRLLFYNEAFESTARATHRGSALFSRDIMGELLPLRYLPERILRQLRECGSEGVAEMYFVSDGDYYEFRSARVSAVGNAACFLMQLENLSRNMEFSRMTTLDEDLRHIYSLFDRIALLDLEADTITLLYVGSNEESAITGEGILRTVAQYAEENVFVEDRGRMRTFYRPETIGDRLMRSGANQVTGSFRTRNRRGEYAWKQHTLVRIRDGAALALIRDAESDYRFLWLRALEKYSPKSAGRAYSHELLWRNLASSSILALYWKDDLRRYRGVSAGFLAFVGLADEDAIRGKTDEEIGWRIHTDHVKNDEIRILCGGGETIDEPAKILVKGINRNIQYCCAPLHDDFGRIIGLIGCLREVDPAGASPSSALSAVRRDGLTGLLNSRGLSEDLHMFMDEFLRRGRDFARIHLTIEDFSALIWHYGNDHCDRILAAVGGRLRQICGADAVLGRVSGARFVVLRQFTREEELHALIDRVKDAVASLGAVDGIPCSLYLAAGSCAFSECRDADRQEHLAETRLLADNRGTDPAGLRLSRAGESFRVFDGLPVSFAVYRLLQDGDKRVRDAEFLYVNQRFALELGRTPEELTGRSVREIFPGLEPIWFEMAHRAGFLGEEVVMERVYFEAMKTHYRVLACQIVRLGCCAFTYQALDGPFAVGGAAHPEPPAAEQRE